MALWEEQPEWPELISLDPYADIPATPTIFNNMIHALIYLGKNVSRLDWSNPTTANGGFQYTAQDGLTASDLNLIVEDINVLRNIIDEEIEDWQNMAFVNGGKPFEGGDGITVQDLNRLINNLKILKDPIFIIPPISPPVIKLIGTDTLEIKSWDTRTELFELYVNGVKKVNIGLLKVENGTIVKNYDLTRLDLWTGTYTITVIGTAEGIGDSSPSNPVKYTPEAFKWPEGEDEPGERPNITDLESCMLVEVNISGLYLVKRPDFEMLQLIIRLNESLPGGDTNYNDNFYNEFKFYTADDDGSLIQCEGLWINGVNVLEYGGPGPGTVFNGGWNQDSYRYFMTDGWVHIPYNFAVWLNYNATPFEG